MRKLPHVILACCSGQTMNAVTNNTDGLVSIGEFLQDDTDRPCSKVTL